ncbi:hypothetical protein HYW18_02525 [Candidatus Uhrbacteria bacterium]|nr:hypothetical protein [Candidatus Uhrbacteria bacterium]
MDSTLLVILIAIGFFVAATAIFSRTKRALCAVCAAISATWILLLVLSRADLFREPRLVAVLMGESAVGVMFLLARRWPAFALFRLPFLLTLTWLTAIIVGVRGDEAPTLIVLLALWSVFILIHLIRHVSWAGALWRRITACCRNW